MGYKDPHDPRLLQKRREHYHNNKEQYLARNRAAAEEKAAYVNELKAKPCTDCGICYPPYVMDFDHLDPSTKKSNVAKLVRYGNWDRLIEEIAKCELVCANCHRERTHGD